MTKAELKRLVEEVNKKADECRMALEEIRDDLQETFDNHTEKWQEGEKGEALQSTIDEMELQMETLNEIAGTSYGLV